jgi:hypothetical protein
MDPWARMDGLNKIPILITNNILKWRGMRTRTSLTRLPHISSTVILLFITSKSILALKYLFFPSFPPRSRTHIAVAICPPGTPAASLSLVAVHPIVYPFFSFRFRFYSLFLDFLLDYTPP